jgi:hypothetical protein
MVQIPSRLLVQVKSKGRLSLFTERFSVHFKNGKRMTGKVCEKISKVVADRWHLFNNPGDAVKKVLGRTQGTLSKRQNRRIYNNLPCWKANRSCQRKHS